jgi:hypothetical protein
MPKLPKKTTKTAQRAQSYRTANKAKKTKIDRLNVAPQATREENESHLNMSTLVPGFLVGLKTSVKGNVTIDKEVIEAPHKVRSGAQKSKVMIERTVQHPEEKTKADQIRMKARSIIVSVCAKSDFGLLCPESKIPELKTAIVEARALAERFNRGAKVTSVSVYVITGRIARDDVEAARAIKSEVRELLKSMSDGVSNLDVKAIREAANKARGLGAMLSPEAADKIKVVIDSVRSTARKITKAGEDAAQEIDREALKTIRQTRSAFLDIEDEATTVAAPVSEARTVDIEDADAALTGRTASEDPAETAPPRRGRRAVETEEA